MQLGFLRSAPQGFAPRPRQLFEKSWIKNFIRRFAVRYFTAFIIEQSLPFSTVTVKPTSFNLSLIHI